MTAQLIQMIYWCIIPLSTIGGSVREIMKPLTTRIILVCLIFATFAVAMTGESPSEQLAQDKIKDILLKTGEYCAKVERVSLYFTCIEEIEERIFYPFRIIESPSIPWRLEENNYTYDYQLIRKREIEESRILLKENGKARTQKNAPLKTVRFRYSNVILGPLGMFRYEAQDDHHYSLEKETKLWGVPVFLIKVVPKRKEGTGPLYGRAWIDRDNGSLLKAEWKQESVINYIGMQDFAKANNAIPGLKQESEYRYEKNGIRFPSRFRVVEDYYQNRRTGGGRRTITKSTLDVIYKNYKFFIVEITTDFIK